jgi:hypothetical protein
MCAGTSKSLFWDGGSSISSSISSSTSSTSIGTSRRYCILIAISYRHSCTNTQTTRMFNHKICSIIHLCFRSVRVLARSEGRQTECEGEPLIPASLVQPQGHHDPVVEATSLWLEQTCLSPSIVVAFLQNVVFVL